MRLRLSVAPSSCSSGTHSSGINSLLPDRSTTRIRYFLKMSTVIVKHDEEPHRRLKYGKECWLRNGKAKLRG